MAAETSSIFLMHKYWGKKPSEELRKIIEQYSKRGDTIFDPFAGFGGFALEGILQNRNVIINDLNPAAVFISKEILDENIDINKLRKLFNSLKIEYQDFEDEWYSYNGNKIITILRSKAGVPLKVRIKKGKTTEDIILSQNEIDEFLTKENNYRIMTWFPEEKLIVNSRISAKQGMTISDLFPKRALICQSYLFDLITKLENCNEKELIKFTFTSNLANCSKLVPPITSRGDMAQGAWMTGFYIGETYLENNVFHYFENRVAKIIKGKETYLRLRQQLRVETQYTILNEDAKQISLKDNSVDLIFTDFPYGDTVPYFEQSQLWNAWLQYTVDYENEIVVSDSGERKKDEKDFDEGINQSILEIYRVLKVNAYFIFTFHSLSGNEWTSIVKALKTSGFVFQDCSVLIQKTLPPRQLNRANSIKGDIVAVYKKEAYKIDEPKNFYEELKIKVNSLDKTETFDTNDLIVMLIQLMLSTNFDNNFEFKDIIQKYFYLDEKCNKWRKL